MLVLISDIHLRPGAQSKIARLAQLERFWQRIELARPERPVQLCFVGDVFDLVRAQTWLDSAHKPYHAPSPELAAEVKRLVDATIAAERPFFEALRARVEAGELVLHYLVGNHDRLLHHAPAARAAVRAALGMKGGDAPFPSELAFAEEGVLAYHGHTVDALCHDPSGEAPLSDMVASELIVRFPAQLRRALELDHPHLDDIDDVRPVIAVPTWVRQLASNASWGAPDGREAGRAVLDVWRGLVDGFLENAHVKAWLKEHHEKLKLDFAQRFKLLLALSARAKPREEPRLTQLYYLLFRLIDSRFAKSAVKALEKKEHRGLHYVVNGHTHYAGMTPLGNVNGEPSVYFNTGTWRTLHQLGNVARGRPAFVAYDAMAYLVFYGPRDPLGRKYEWWQGAAG